MFMPKLYEMRRVNITVLLWYGIAVEGGKKHSKLLNWKCDESYVFLDSLKVFFCSVSNRPNNTRLAIIMSAPVYELGRNTSTVAGYLLSCLLLST